MDLYNFKIYRHGQRNIFSGYPKDPYKDLKFWPGGYAQLTNVKKKFY